MYYTELVKELALELGRAGPVQVPVSDKCYRAMAGEPEPDDKCCMYKPEDSTA